jgi:hypothetical protein
VTPSATPATEPADTSRDANESKVRSSARRISERFPRLGVMLLIAALVLVLNGITLHKVSSVSNLDEQYWVDHLVRGSHFEIEQSGDVITQEALRELCKRGFEGGAPGPPCHAGHLDPRKYLPKGVNYAGHSPFYFLITGPIARVLRASPIDLPPNDSLLTWGRLLGSAWLLLGIYLTLRAGELLNVRRSILVIALILIAATPALLHADTIVNPDATAFAAGAGVLYAGLLWERRGKGIWFVALAALIAAAFDPTNGIGVFVVLAYFALRAIGRATSNDDKNDKYVRSWQEYAKVAAVIVVAAVLANRGWDRLYGFLQDNVLTQPPPIPKGKNPITHAYAVDSLSLTQLIGSQTIFSLLPPFADVALPAARSDAFYTTLAKGAELLTLVGIGAVLLRDRLTSAISTLGFALLAALLACPTLLVIYNYVVGSTYDAPVARYGLSALPAVAIVLAAAVRTRFSELVLVAVAAGLYVSAIVVVLVA